MRKTARQDLIECVGSWPGVLLRELIDDGELNHSTDHLVAEVSRMRAAGYLEPCYPARLRVKPEWRKIVQTSPFSKRAHSCRRAVGFPGTDHHSFWRQVIDLIPG